LFGQFRDGALRAIVDDQWVTCLHQVAGHGLAHDAQSDKTDSWKWHRCSSRGVSPWNYAPGCSDSMTFFRLRTAFSDSTCMNCSNCRSICYSKIELVRGPLAALAARHPVEGVVRRGAGHVLQPNEAVIAGLHDGAEDLTPVDFARAGFMPARVIRNL